MPLLPAVGGEGIMFFGRTSVVHPSVIHCLYVDIYFTWHDISVLSGEFQLDLAQVFTMWVGTSDMDCKVRGQRSRSYVYKCVSAVMAGAYISTLWHRDSLVCQISSR